MEHYHAAQPDPVEGVDLNWTCTDDHAGTHTMTPISTATGEQLGFLALSDREAAQIEWAIEHPEEYQAQRQARFQEMLRAIAGQN